MTCLASEKNAGVRHKGFLSLPASFKKVSRVAAVALKAGTEIRQARSLSLLLGTTCGSSILESINA